MKIASPKGTLVALGFVLSVLGNAQSTIALEYPPTMATGGVLSLVEWQGSNGTQQMPHKATYTTSVAAPGTGYSVIWDVRRTHGYNRVSGTFYQLGSVQGVHSASHAWFSGTKEIDFQQAFFSWFGSRTNEEDKYGRFDLQLQYRPSGSTYTTLTILTWDLRPQDQFQGGTGQNGNGANNGGGVGANSPTEEAQQNFWSSLFVPSEECLNDVKDAAAAFTEWGPIGLSNDVLDAMQATETQMATSATFGVSLGGATQNMNVDTSPFAGAFGTVRALLAGLMWFGVLMGAWRLAMKMM